ncbi:slit homolog 2 protein-like [Lytechinus pictus]|uniref:slit homolog 2 protein-like n=1 Tax=Lytechinus pictus TaxID=7653 RepID=UPI0030BA1C67
MMGINGPLFYTSLLICCLLPFTFQLLMTPSTLDQESLGCVLNVELKTAFCGNSGLNSIPQTLFEDILHFELFRNNITSLLSWSFERYPLITRLDLSRNDIRVIAKTALHPLEHLMYLDISHNPHLVLPDEGLLRWARNLSTLNLFSSNLQALPNHDILKWSPRLEYVRLYNNHLKSVHVGSCGTLTSLILSDNKIEQINQDTFHLDCHIDLLDLLGNPLQSVDPEVVKSLHVNTLIIGDHPLTFKFFKDLFYGVSLGEIDKIVIINASVSGFPNDFFKPLHDHPLRHLEFSYDELDNLYPHVFSNLTQVYELSFGNDYIPKIEPDYFEGMHGLKVLTIEYNQLKYINTESQSWKVDLTELHLAGNMLTKITPHTFWGLKNLTFLDLSDNDRLATFMLKSFSGLDNLEVINLSECNVFQMRLYTPSLRWLSMSNIVAPWSPLVPEETFRETKSLVSLDMLESELRDYNLWNAAMNVSIFDGLVNLKTLDLSDNTDLGKSLPKYTFRELSALEELRIEYCHISTVHHLTFQGLVSLQKLSLRGNIIQTVHPRLFQGLVQVTSINLKGNKLEYLDKGIFSTNANLTTLSLADNKLTSLNQSTFQPIKTSLSSLDLSVNPINCICDLSWLLSWLRNSLNLVNKEETICSLASLEGTKHKPLLDFDIEKLCRINIILCVVLPLAAICLVAGVGFVYHNRWQLRFKLYLLKLAALGYKEIRDARDHNEFEFDLNIIFYDDDEEWIREHLQPALEERLPQFERNVFGDEDLVLGMHYLDSVDYVVSRSYKTLIVLSRAAVRDRWFMLKLRIAMDHVSDTRTEFVVAIFLEDIPDDEIPFLARLYLSDGRPYLQWPNDERGQECFWNELSKGLTINLRTNDLIPNE